MPVEEAHVYVLLAIMEVLENIEKRLAALGPRE